MIIKEVVDLSWKYTKNIKVFDGGEPLIIRKERDISEDGSTELTTMDSFCMHYGTHLDCPGHMIDGGFRVEDKPASYFVGKGRVVDCTAYGPEEKIGMEVLDSVDLEGIDFLLFYINWGLKFGTKKQYRDYPTLSVALASFLGSHQTLKGIGIETNNCDVVGDATFPVHRAFLGNNSKILMEALTNLDRLLDKTFLLVAAPLLVEGAEAGPCRAVALVEEQESKA